MLRPIDEEPLKTLQFSRSTPSDCPSSKESAPSCQIGRPTFKVRTSAFAFRCLNSAAAEESPEVHDYSEFPVTACQSRVTPPDKATVGAHARTHDRAFSEAVDDRQPQPHFWLD